MKYKVSSIWAKEGSTNIQKDSMSRHCNSYEHQTAEKMLLSSIQDFCQNSSNSDSGAVLIDTDDMKLFRTVFYAAKEEMPSVKINILLESQFLAYVYLPDGKVHTIVNETINFLTKLGLESSKIVLLATDGAATMLGKKIGVGVQMTANRHLIWCRHIVWLTD